MQGRRGWAGGGAPQAARPGAQRAHPKGALRSAGSGLGRSRGYAAPQYPGNEGIDLLPKLGQGLRQALFQ